MTGRPVPTLTLRRAGPEDAEAVRILSRMAYAQWVPLIGREPRPMTADYEVAVRDHIVDLYEQAGRLVALIEMAPERDHLLIVNIAVLPERHGQGLGDGLLRHAETVARTLGFAEARLYTNAAFASNIAFYGRRGYSETHREVLPVGTVVHMKKPLRAAG